jgi:MraZ protein
MFLGTFEPNILDNFRLALPKKIREELGGRDLVLTTGFEQCIFGFADNAWEEITKVELSRPLFSDKEGRDLRRKMCATAVKVSLDAQGRFIIPEIMSNFAKIEKTAVVIGAGDHFEIWSREKWEDYRKNISG